jgi:exopolysaccharide biosynthesis polyprenyl glycosylphosphotransferase
MFKDQREQAQFVKQTADVLIVILAFVLAYALRTKLGWLSKEGIGPIGAFIWLPICSLGIHLYTYYAFGFYESLRHKSIGWLGIKSLQAFVAEFFVLGSMVFFLQQLVTSRWLFLLYLILNYALLFLSRVFAQFLVLATRGREYNLRRVLLVGDGDTAERYYRDLLQNKEWSVKVTGWLGSRNETSIIPAELCMGEISDLKQILRKEALDEVHFALEKWDAAQLQEWLSVCESVGVMARLSLQFLGKSQYKAALSPLGETQVLSFYTHWMTPLEALTKRALDIFGALVGLTLTAAAYPWVAYRIRKESPGPVIFKQMRVGESGRRFKCYKFRTMTLDAEAQKKDLMDLNQMQGPIFKIDHDPRIFEFGKFLRRSSIDELPQFLNVLRGEMSLVGPRPPTPDEVAKYRTHYRRRFSVRPGITGLWQVSGRNRISNFEDILSLDLKYIEQWSLLMDLKILALTVWVVVAKRGAR